VPKIKVGQVDYLNCLPVYHALEENILPHSYDIVKGPPTRLNEMFLNNRLAVTPISSIEYARNSDNCIILPGMSITADGKVSSILLFSKVPVTELEGKKVCLTSSSATSVALLKILFEHYFHVDTIFETTTPNLESMLKKGDGALLIGDDAMLAHHLIKEKEMSVRVTDLGETWKEFTGEKMVYALWVVKESFARSKPEIVDQITEDFQQSRRIGWSDPASLVNKAHKKSGLPLPVVDDYFQTIQHDLGDDEKRALLTFFDYAYKSDLISERTQLKIWGEYTL
jgi:chorismate dehydratase